MGQESGSSLAGPLQAVTKVGQGWSGGWTGEGAASKPAQVVGRIHFCSVLDMGPQLLSGVGQRLPQQLDVTLGSLPLRLPKWRLQSPRGDETPEQVCAPAQDIMSKA